MYSETSRVQHSTAPHVHRPQTAQIKQLNFEGFADLFLEVKCISFVLKLQYCVLGALWKRVNWSTLHHDKQDCVE